MTRAFDDYLRRWRLVPEGARFETSSAELIYVSTHDGNPAVLKIAKPQSDERSTAPIFAHWTDAASVRIYAHDDCALLMERARPGVTLVPLVLDGRDGDATAILCDTIAALHARPAPPGDWKRLDADWSRGFTRQRARPPHPILSYSVIDEAERVYLELCRTQSGQFLLHGDLHHENVLLDAHRGWLAIDPKGVVGEIAFEVTAALGNPIPHLDFYARADVMQQRVRIFGERLKLSEDRILKWLSARWVLGAIWWLEDGRSDADLKRGMQVVRTARQLLGVPT